MKSIFWTQNADVNEENSVYIDGKPSKDYSTSEVDVAFRRISQYQLDDDFAYIDFQRVCERYNLPQNFKFFVDMKRGTFLQATFLEKDDYGRPMPFMVWTDSANPQSAVKELVLYSKMCGKSIDKSDLNNYLKAWNHMNRRYNAVKWIIISLVVIIIYLIIAWLLWN